MSTLFHNFVTKNIYYSKRFLNQHKQFPKSFKNFQFKPTTFQEKTYFTTMSEGKKKSANSFDEIDNNDGAFKRKPTSFHDEIKVGSKYPPAKGRYQLYVCLACPWASRCLAVLALKGIERDVIDVAVTWPIFDVVNEKEGTKSWVFKPKGTTYDGVPVHDPLYGFKSLRELYEKNDSEYTGKYTVPVLWDKETESIVNNESSEILRLFNDQFNEWAKNPSVDVSPKDKLKEIDAINDSFYNTLNNGVYRAGFAQKQEAYDEAYNDVFNTLDALEEKLNKSRFLLGKDEPLTECDIRLFVTIIRFDAVYQFHFKCNKRPISSYPNIYNWMRDVYQTPGIADTVQMKHIKDHYFKSHASVNPSFIVPNGPDLESFNAPHDRNTRKYD